MSLFSPFHVFIRWETLRHKGFRERKRLLKDYKRLYKKGAHPFLGFATVFFWFASLTILQWSQLRTMCFAERWIYYMDAEVSSAPKALHLSAIKQRAVSFKSLCCATKSDA